MSSSVVRLWRMFVHGERSLGGFTIDIVEDLVDPVIAEIIYRGIGSGGT